MNNVFVAYFRGAIYIIFSILLFVKKDVFMLSPNMKYALAAVFLTYGLFRIYRAYVQQQGTKD